MNDFNNAYIMRGLHALLRDFAPYIAGKLKTEFGSDWVAICKPMRYTLKYELQGEEILKNNIGDIDTEEEFISKIDISACCGFYNEVFCSSPKTKNSNFANVVRAVKNIRNDYVGHFGSKGCSGQETKSAFRVMQVFCETFGQDFAAAKEKLEEICEEFRYRKHRTDIQEENRLLREEYEQMNDLIGKKDRQITDLETQIKTLADMPKDSAKSGKTPEKPSVIKTEKPKMPESKFAKHAAPKKVDAPLTAAPLPPPDTRSVLRWLCLLVDDSVPFNKNEQALETLKNFREAVARCYAAFENKTLSEQSVSETIAQESSKLKCLEWRRDRLLLWEDKFAGHPIVTLIINSLQEEYRDYINN